MRGGERREKEAFGRLCISRRNEQELKCVSLRVKGSRQIQPLLFDFDVHLINAPGIRSRSQMRSATSVEFRRNYTLSLIDPAIDGRMIDVQSTSLALGQRELIR
jgi:hypothetical protein